MNDRELLELAAKAAGILLVWDGDSPKEVTEHWSCDPTEPPHEREWEWNPRTDDGDALRLAVRRRFTIKIFSARSYEGGFDCPGFVEIWADDDSDDPITTEYATDGDYDAATRRAIVRAAAEIGCQMQEGGAA